nr:CIH_HP1_G0052130.mRNA.1.CDS.1 [Saccharomyces cerevisiae]
MQYFRYCILLKSFLLVVGFFFKTRRLPVLMFMNVPIASSATPRQEKKYSHARIYRMT